AKWAGSADQRRRESALAKARARLLMPMPPPSRLPKPFALQLADWRIGEVIGFRTAQDRLALLHVTRFSRCSKLKVRAPTTSLLLWRGKQMPKEGDLAKLSYIRHPLAPSGLQTMPRLLLAAPRRSPLDPARFLRPGLTLELAPREEVGEGLPLLSEGRWSLDEILDKAL